MADLLQIDALQLYFGDPYVINDNIIIYQPKIKDIVLYGERDYMSMIHTLTSIPSDLKSQLWDMGVDWTQISDFDLFVMLSQTMTPDKTSIVLGELDLSALRPFKNPQNDQIVLANRISGVVIDELIYERIVNYLRQLHGLKKKVEHAANEFTKKFMIEEDRQKIAYNKNKPYESFLLPMISAVKARQGYTLDYIKNEGLAEFFDEISRLQIIHNADALLHGAYSGMVDTSKINKNEFNWMREISKA